jgi:hypothetical protein
MANQIDISWKKAKKPKHFHYLRWVGQLFLYIIKVFKNEQIVHWDFHQKCSFQYFPDFTSALPSDWWEVTTWFKPLVKCAITYWAENILNVSNINVNCHEHTWMLCNKQTTAILFFLSIGGNNVVLFKLLTLLLSG